jgi:hypothetical protein
VRKSFKFLLISICCLCIFVFAACAKTDDNEAQKSAAPTATFLNEPTATIEATLAPTAAPTLAPTQKPAPKPTVTPGQLTYAGGIASEEPPEEQVMICDLNGAPTHFQIFEDMAIQFFPTTAFTEVSVCCPSYSDSNGTLTFALYAWMGSYEGTVTGGAIQTKTFENYFDNELLTLKFEEALPDGEYLLVMSTTTGSAGVGAWCKAGSFEGQKVYFDGGVPITEQTELHAELRVSYVNTPNNMYGKVS